MARQASFRIAEVADLFRQLRVVSANVRRRAMDSAEALIDDIEPQRNYPLEFVVYRVTGFRSPSVEPSATLVGEILLGDLVTLVQRLSATMTLAEDFSGRRPLVLDEVADRLNVSLKTVQRYRRLGLVCHEVELKGTSRIVCFADALQRFVDSGRAPIRRASAFTRLSADVEQRMIEIARRLRDTGQLSLNEAAKRIAAEHDRAHETVRGVLQRHDRSVPNPIFTERGPLTAREHRMIFRAHERGVTTSDIVRRVGRSRKAVHRAVLRQRGQRLRDLDISYLHMQTFDRADVEQVMLSPALVRSRLNQPEVSDDALELIADSHDWLTMPVQDEHALLGAYNYLKQRAVIVIADLSSVPGAAAMDAIETELRWAARLKRKLVLHGFAVALQRVEQNLHRPLSTAPRETIVSSIELAAETAKRMIETVDPQKDQQTARVCGYAMERTLAASPPRSIESQAAARHDAGTIRVRDPFQHVCAWQDVVEPPMRCRDQLDQLDADTAALLVAHFGWGEAPPQSCANLAEQRKTTASAIRRSIDTALAALRRSVRRAPDDEK